MRIICVGVTGCVHKQRNGLWTLGGGCTSAAFDGGTGNPPGSLLLNSCGESGSDPFASQAVSGLSRRNVRGLS